mmetsp:Transcript_14654/g.21356  ORF Transcript_14654/g.21356 Transcript_14654/m.21356 type:complete len:332 (+) Transcript_14654:902-1897(+)
MGCCKSKNLNSEQKHLYRKSPNFTYFCPENLSMVKFKSQIQSKKQLPLETNRLPLRSLVCKVSGKQFIVCGGYNMQTRQESLSTLLVNLDSSCVSELSHLKLPFPVYGGLMYFKEGKLLIAGACQMTDQKTFEKEQCPFPFVLENQKPPLSWSNLHKMKPVGVLECFIHEESTWNVVDFSKTTVKSNVIPSDLMLPGTCLLGNRIYFFGGVNGELIPNNSIVFFDFKVRLVKEASIKSNFEVLLDSRCSPVTENKIVILGGFSTEDTVNNKYWLYKIDQFIDELGETNCNAQFKDKFPPSGKYGFGVFFSYPQAVIYDSVVDTFDNVTFSN